MGFNIGDINKVFVAGSYRKYRYFHNKTTQ